MATFTKPYPPESANRAAVWISREGQDLLTYYTPRGDPNPSFDRFVAYYTDFVPYNPFTDTASPPPTVAPVPAGETSVSVPEPAPTETPSSSFQPPVSRETVSMPSAPIGENAPVILPRVGFYKTLVSESRHGYDNLLTFADGTQKILNHYFLPPLFEPGALAGGAYVFGTVLDPEVATRAGRPPSQKWLYSEAKQGLDRVAFYSDGSSQRAAGWFAANPQYADDSGEIPTAEILLADPRTITPTNDPTVPTAPPPPPPVVPVPGVVGTVGTVAPGGQIVPPGVPTAAPSVPPSVVVYSAPPPTLSTPPPPPPRAPRMNLTPPAVSLAPPVDVSTKHISTLILAVAVGAFLFKQ